LVISASDRQDDINEAIRSGADEYLIRTEEPELLGNRLTIAERRAEENTTRQRIMSALTESESRFRDLLETAPDAIYRVDLDGRIRLVNGHAERMTRYRREELIGQSV
jgi:PAS domain-containing protein